MILQIAVAFALDMFIGDPGWFPHPVKGMGKFIRILERLLYKPYFNLRAGGIILALLVVGVSWLGGFFALYLATRAGKWLEFILGTFIIFTTLSVNGLAREAKDVYLALDNCDTNLARKRLARIVGRDTENLSEPDMVRATVESVAESSVDGIVSPLFYAFLGGAPLALAYKAVNTLDSMLGYKNEKYLCFGWFSAKLDDLANFISARAGALLIPLAAFLGGRKSKPAFKIMLRDGRNSPSPNAGISEAGFAGALGIRLGGTNFYQGEKEERPFIGDISKELTKEDILSAIRLMQVLSFISLLIFGAVWWIFVNLV